MSFPHSLQVMMQVSHSGADVRPSCICRYELAGSWSRILLGVQIIAIVLLMLVAKTHMFEHTNKIVYCPLQEDGVPCHYVRIVYVKDCKQGVHHLVQLLPL